VWIYKKVDSVLRGNVIAEVHAIKQALDSQSALLVPANPCFGRVIRGGHYFVNGKPIDQTDFARDPEYPRRTSNVLDLLGVAQFGSVIIGRLSTPLPASGIILGEVSSSEDVQRWAARHEKKMLFAGGAEFFGALLKVLGPSCKVSKLSDSPAQSSSAQLSELFVCGSSSDFTDQFVNTARANGTPVFSLLESTSSNKRTRVKGLAEKAVLAFHSHHRVILTIGRPILTNRSVAHKLANNLATLARSVIAKSKPAHIFAEGGATAAELVRQLGWSRMTVLSELAPGVTTLSRRHRALPFLTIKPGSYPGWPVNSD
jgi:uncharacterized protein YgbK (DUF1537 family)